MEEKIHKINSMGTGEDRMKAFLTEGTDAYAILQLNQYHPDVTVYELFESLDCLTMRGKKPDISHYDVVYTAPLTGSGNDLSEMLENLYVKFNMNIPDDFRGHSMSVSDVVALRQNGTVTCHYVDDVGFKELPGFLDPAYYLKEGNNEMH